MKRLIAFGFAFALTLGTAQAQVDKDEEKQEREKSEYSKLIPEVARLLERLPEAQREEIKKQLAELETVPQRVEYLRQVIEEYGKALAPEGLPNPEEFRDRLLKQAMDQFRNMDPEQRRQMMEQAQKFMEMMPPEQREELMRNFMKGLVPAPQPKEDPKKDPQSKKEEARGPEWLEEARRYADEARQLYEAWQAMPEESRQQMMNDLVDGLKIYFEDNIQPEIDRELARLQREAAQAIQEVERIQRLPREERRRVVRERLESLARRFLGEEEEGEDY